MIAVPLIKKIAELFLILFAAAAMVKAGLLKSEDSRVLSRITLYFITPCVLFNSFQEELTPEIRQGLLIAAGLALGIQLVYFLIAGILRRVWKATEVERASIIFTNAGNLVIPLVAYARGQNQVIYVSAYILVFNLLFWTFGIRMFDSTGSSGIKKLLLNPNILAIAAGFLTLVLHIRLPEPVAIAFSDTASMVGPVTMIITGLVVGGCRFRDLFANRRVIGVVFFRMIACSGVAVLITALLAKSGCVPAGKEFLIIPLLSAIAPTAANINQVAILYNKDPQYASCINILTTLSCIVTIPLWIMLYEAIAG